MLKKRKQESGRTEAPAKPSGLKPVFPKNASCCRIASPFGSQTRYDGSPRPSHAPGGGSHGGIDLSLDEGTPLLALAAGTVLKKGEGRQMEGIYIWLQHAPEDTGLPYYVFSKYQHLQSVPDLPLNEPVSAGQEIGRSGKTGTAGGHYGGEGYPHLHLTTRKSADGDFKSSTLFDPLEIYNDAGPDPKEKPGSLFGKKPVHIPYVTEDGQLHPKDTRVVWPVACQPE